MARLEDLAPGATLQGMLPKMLVPNIDGRRHGGDTCHAAAGRAADRLLHRQDETPSRLAQGGRFFVLVGETILAGRTPPRSWSGLPYATGLFDDEGDDLLPVVRREARIRGCDA